LKVPGRRLLHTVRRYAGLSLLEGVAQSWPPARRRRYAATNDPE